MRTKSGHKRGDIDPATGRVFWSIQRGKEYWIAPEDFEPFMVRQRASVKSWQQANKKRNCQLVKEWRNRNPERAKQIQRAATKKHAEANPELSMEKWHRRRARKKNATAPDNNPRICKIMQRMRIRVQKCTGIKWTLDHVLPLDAGGVHAHYNLQLLPRTLNSAKRGNPDFPLPDCYRRP